MEVVDYQPKATADVDAHVARKAKQPESETRTYPSLNGAAKYGLVGDIVEAISPHTEADPVSIGAQSLVAFGSAVGRNPYMLVGRTRHHANEFLCLVGDTAKARKGSSWDWVRSLFMEANPDWQACHHSGLSSGEGLIWVVRDRIEKLNKKGEIEVVDEGVDDKRAIVSEGEFSRVLRVIRREGNTLQDVMRDAWDSQPLGSMVKNSPARCMEPHTSVIAHITAEELQRELSETSAANGFANRFLFACVKRSKCLPFGGEPDPNVMAELCGRIRHSLGVAQRCGPLKWSEESRDLWEEIYPSLSQGNPGLLGAMTGRAEAHTLRLACLYALADGSDTIHAEHLIAGTAMWTYCEDSVRYLLGDKMGDPVADTILSALKQSDRLTRTDISGLFGRHVSAGRISEAIDQLSRLGRARLEQQNTSGRPIVWLVRT